MTTRRNFLKTGGLSLASLMVGQHSFARMAEKADDKLAGAASTTQYVCKRPVPSKRQFTSEAVEKAIATTKAKLKDPKARLDVRKLFSKYIGYDLRTQDGEW